MYTLLSTKYKNGNPTLNNITWFFEKASLKLSIDGTVLGTIPFEITQILGLASSLVSIKFSQIASLLECFNNKFKSTAQDLKTYFASLNTAMENVNDVVMMKIRYRFTKEWFTRYIDAHQTYRATDESVYTYDIITSYEHIGSSMSGKVYGISDSTQLEKLLK